MVYIMVIGEDCVNYSSDYWRKQSISTLSEFLKSKIMLKVLDETKL